MVRLEVTVPTASVRSVEQFQFQNGTIRRGVISYYSDWYVKFQFQNGTIRRSNCAALNAENADFNSKMVRLEEP